MPNVENALPTTMMIGGLRFYLCKSGDFLKCVVKFRTLPPRIALDPADKGFELLGESPSDGKNAVTVATCSSGMIQA
jgi:hypothetical protein